MTNTLNPDPGLLEALIDEWVRQQFRLENIQDVLIQEKEILAGIVRLL